MEDPRMTRMMEMDQPEAPSSAAASAVTDGIGQIGEDVLQNILSKLPAKAFASAACVSRTWNVICARILSRPKLATALSLNPSLHDAVKEILDRVLAEPIRPHFAILSIEYTHYGLEDAHQLICEKIGSAIPIITCEASGIIGRDAITDEFREVKFEYYDAGYNSEERHRPGVLLTVGYVPGLKVDIIPLLHMEEPANAIDKFVEDIWNYSAFVSGCTSPDAIIMFGDPSCDMKPVLDNMDSAMSTETIIVGNERGRFKYRSCDISNNSYTITRKPRVSFDAVALLFARDKSISPGLGQTQFHFSLAAGAASIGPTYKAVSVKVRNCDFATWITARREGLDQILDGQQMLEEIDNEMGNVSDSDLFIMLTKRRKGTIRSEKVESVTSAAYHHVLDADEQYLYLRGLDIKTGDLFRFHVPDRKFALSSCGDVSVNFMKWKHELKSSSCKNARNATPNRGKEVIGAILFTCCARGESFFGAPNVDSSPISDNFPGIPLAGMFCCGEIGRGPLLSTVSEGSQGKSSIHSPLHVHSSVYLVLTYNPAPCTT
ncbi:hypothetical protein Ancab_039187 [Ancistrocladus abbreviatus]